MVDERTQGAVRAMTERLRNDPVPFNRTMRVDNVSTVTSGDAGLAQPLAFIPVLREDAVETSRFQARAYMEETADLLLNTVYCTFSAWFVPKLGFERFGKSMDAFNRSYMGQPEADGDVIDWHIVHQFGPSPEVGRAVYRAAGLHAQPGQLVNMDYIEAYRAIFEHRCKTRSEALWNSVSDLVKLDAQTLAPAFFDSPQMAMVKASFDVGQMEGIVPLNVVNSTLPIKTQTPNDEAQYMSTDASSEAYMSSTANQAAAVKLAAELQDEGFTVSLANIHMATETQAWARVKASYSGIEDDDLVDLLMAGLRIPDAYADQPVLLDRAKVPFGMTQRYSTEAENLDISATRGVAGADLTLRLPQSMTGGVIVVLAEVVPEQFWERKADQHFLANTQTKRPDRLLDELDPQPIVVVENGEVDTAHDDPTGIFGYAPLNYEYMRQRFNLGGKFWKNDPEAEWTEDRNRVWASEPVNATLSKEFFLATDLPKDVFMQTQKDNFEFSLAGTARISGLTYIGPMLREQSEDYQSIIDRLDTGRIEPALLESDAGSDDVVVDEDCDETETVTEGETTDG